MFPPNLRRKKIMPQGKKKQKKADDRRKVQAEDNLDKVIRRNQIAAVNATPGGRERRALVKEFLLANKRRGK